jgi:hypothetical protein
VGLLEDALHASGGLHLWRQAQRFTAHVSIGGALCTRKCSSARLKELLVEGSTRDQVLEITGFMAADRRALYRPDWVALEGSDGRRLKERAAAPAEFHAQLASTTWDELLLAHYCGYFIWNYMNAPFVLSDPDFEIEEVEPRSVRGEIWRRLRVRFPPRMVTHSAEQTFYFDSQGIMRRQDYLAPHDGRTRVAQMFSAHQRFSGVLVPTLCRLLRLESDGAPIAKPPLLDIEIFDAVFD